MMPYFDEKRKRWMAAVMVHGERKRKSFPPSQEKKAVAWEVSTEKEMQTQEHKPVDMQLRVFFSLYLDYAELHFSRKTFQEKRSLLQVLSKRWGGETLVSEINPAMIAEYLQKRATDNFGYAEENKQSRRTASNHASNKDRKNLHALWQWGMEIHGLPVNPVKSKKLPHAEQSQYTPPEQDMLKVLMAATKSERVFLDAYLQTGARKSEIFRWKWDEDINFDSRQVRLGTRKTGDGSMEYEWLRMTPDLFASLKWLQDHKPVPESPFVFVITKPGRHYGQPFVDRRRFLKGLCRRAGVREFGYHALRRFVASILADKHKISSKSIQGVLRHKRLTTTEKYIKNIHHGIDSVMDLLSSDQNSDLPQILPHPQISH